MCDEKILDLCQTFLLNWFVLNIHDNNNNKQWTFVFCLGRLFTFFYHQVEFYWWIFTFTSLILCISHLICHLQWLIMFVLFLFLVYYLCDPQFTFIYYLRWWWRAVHLGIYHNGNQLWIWYIYLSQILRRRQLNLSDLIGIFVVDIVHQNTIN